MEKTTATRKQRFQSLLDTGVEINEKKDFESIDHTFSSIQLLINESNKINAEGSMREKTENSAEVVMDIQLIKMTHEIVNNLMLKMGNSEFSDEDFINGIKNFINEPNGLENWDLLSSEAVKIIRTTKSSLNILGTFDSNETFTQIQKQRQKREKLDIGELKKPSQISKIAAEDSGADKITIIMNQIHTIYKKRGDLIPYYELVTDPYNFMHTIDNAFQISFLIKDGAVALDMGTDGLPAIRPIDKTEKDKKKDKTKKHILMSFTPILWREMAKKYKIKKPLLVLERNDDANTSRAVNE